LIATVLFGFVMHLAIGAFASEQSPSNALASGRRKPAGIAPTESTADAPRSPHVPQANADDM
jgi:hypothetical protein